MIKRCETCGSFGHCGCLERQLASRLASLTAERDRLREERDRWRKEADIDADAASTERAAREQAESRLSEAVGLLRERDGTWVDCHRGNLLSIERCPMTGGCWDHRRAAFLASPPANPTEEKGRTK